MNHKILHINSSGRVEGSVTRDISAQLVSQLQQQTGYDTMKLDLAEGLPFVDEQWIGANFTDPEQRSDRQKAKLALSDSLVSDLQEASHIVIAAPIYNFSVPAVLKAWIDMVARARVTFRYTENGPEGLLKGKKAYLVVASGGVPLESDYDFATPYLKQVMGFLGIDDVTVINTNELGQAANEAEVVEKLSAIAENS